MAASNYDACLSKTLAYEGGYVNHPSDPGGATNYGITIAVARKHWNARITPEGMKTLPLSAAKAIYRAEYWEKVKGDSLPAGPDLCNFDFAVNSGVSRANSYHAAMPKLAPVDYVKAYCKKRLAFVQSLKTWGTFGKGWARRIASVEAVGVKMALQASGEDAEAVKKELQKEAKKASTKSKAQATTSASTAGGSATTAPSLPDVSTLDTSTTAGLIVVGIVVACVVGYFAYRAYINHQRSQAYAGAAKEVK
jgi:lysozyme family protein